MSSVSRMISRLLVFVAVSLSFACGRSLAGRLTTSNFRARTWSSPPRLPFYAASRPRPTADETAMTLNQTRRSLKAHIVVLLCQDLLYRLGSALLFLGPFRHAVLHPVTRDGTVGVRAEVPADDQPNELALPGDQRARITPGTED